MTTRKTKTQEVETTKPEVDVDENIEVVEVEDTIENQIKKKYKDHIVEEREGGFFITRNKAGE